MIGIVAHIEKADARGAIETLLRELDQRKIPYLLEAKVASCLGLSSDFSVNELARKSDLLVVMGGDGTILRVLHQMHDSLRPIFGINLGSLGFLSCLGQNELARAADALLKKDFLLSLRTLLAIEMHYANGERESYFALNDVTISRGERSQLVKLKVRINGDVLTDYNADGLVIATPTGSTAYSLSAGGPILMPQSSAFVVTPICPHVLTNRSVVVADSSLIEVKPLESQKEVFVSIDGLKPIAMGQNDLLKAFKYGRNLSLAMLPERSFSDVLRQKLKWSGSNI